MKKCILIKGTLFLLSHTKKVYGCKVCFTSLKLQLSYKKGKIQSVIFLHDNS